MRITENKLQKIFEKAKIISQDFKNLQSMLLTFPESLLILRLSAKEGSTKFGTACGVYVQNLKEIESGKSKLGHKRVNRILTHFSNKKLDFNWNNILKTFRVFSSISRDGFFGRESLLNLKKFSLKKKRKISILGLKSTPPNTFEKTVLDILNSRNISFEWQAPILSSMDSVKMIVVDFAIPNSKSPKLFIEVTEGKMRWIKTKNAFSSLTFEKLISGHRIKRFMPEVNILLVSKLEIEPRLQSLLREVFDFVLTKETLNKLPKIISEINAN